LGDVLLELVLEPGRDLDPLLERDEGRDRLALDVVRLADDGGLGNRLVVDEGGLHLHRRDAVTGDVHDVVHAAEQPEVAVLVALGAVAGLPFSSKTSASTPGNGVVADPGLRTVMPGSGVMRICPVSVCHQVSTTGHRPPPMTFQYQTHASGLIGSPTVPSSRRLERSHRFGYSSPHFMNVLIAVGAV